MSVLTILTALRSSIWHFNLPIGCNQVVEFSRGVGDGGGREWWLAGEGGREGRREDRRERRRERGGGNEGTRGGGEGRKGGRTTEGWMDGEVGRWVGMERGIA